jgi:hypothetical protein
MILGVRPLATLSAVLDRGGVIIQLATSPKTFVQGGITRLAPLDAILQIPVAAMPFVMGQATAKSVIKVVIEWPPTCVCRRGEQRDKAQE